MYDSSVAASSSAKSAYDSSVAASSVAKSVYDSSVAASTAKSVYDSSVAASSSAKSVYDSSVAASSSVSSNDDRSSTTVSSTVDVSVRATRKSSAKSTANENKSSSNSYNYVSANKAIKLKVDGKEVTIKPSSETNIKLFKVTRNSKGWHYLLDINGKNVKLTTKNDAFNSLYYHSNEAFKRSNGKLVVYIKKNIREHSDYKFSSGKDLKVYHSGDKLLAKKIIASGHTYRIELTNGNYITANRYFVSHKK
ncbi:DUF5776 domain-containing protein [Nicoliella lavandulae]|uniref:DUF5776 domain-containing protein n=1 Tax=Nicoliella lavandulae TaxID=3082954 RepID=A0ABU8SJ72_9LACO